MPYGIKILCPAELAISHRIVEDETGAADQMAGLRVVDRAVVFEEVIEAATRVDGAGMIERHCALDMFEQELAAAKVRSHGPFVVTLAHRPA